MDASHNDLEALRRILADLTTRVYRIEQKLRIEPEAAIQAPTAAVPQPPPSRAFVTDATSERVTQPPPPPYIPPRKPVFPAEPQADLESRIGSHWLNRIGIAALLIGISYFLKFAFDNNWIGPAGRDRKSTRLNSSH